MSQKPYTVLAILQAKPEKENILKEALQSLIQPTRQETGCLNYDFFENIHQPGQFMFYENWASQESHQKHDNSSHINKAREKLSEIAGHVEVSFWKQID